LLGAVLHSGHRSPAVVCKMPARKTTNNYLLVRNMEVC